MVSFYVPDSFFFFRSFLSSSQFVYNLDGGIGCNLKEFTFLWAVFITQTYFNLSKFLTSVGSNIAQIDSSKFHCLMDDSEPIEMLLITSQ